MKRLLILAVYIFSCALFCSAADTPENAGGRFRSPKGKFEIGFKPQAQRLFAGPHQRPLPPDIKSQTYSVSFYPTGKETAVAIAYFTDIQPRPDSRFPVPAALLAGQVLWSPDEDFAVLPKENWPRAPEEKPAPRQAISLQLSSVWQFADFPFTGNELFWISPRQAIGNVIEGCREEVREFDGRSGRTTLFQSADPPQGYRILAADGKNIVLRQVLGSCADETQRQAFQPGCMTMNVSFGRREIGPCPP